MFRARIGPVSRVPVGNLPLRCSIRASEIWQQGICRVAPRVLCEVAYMMGTVCISSDSRETQRLRLG